MHEYVSQLISSLEKTISPDPNELKAAERFLEESAAQNLQEFLKSLSEIIKFCQNSPVSREAACLVFKNRIYSKDTQTNNDLKQLWMSYPEEYRSYVKANIVGALGTEHKTPSLAAQCIAYIAAIEIPLNAWPELIDLLVQNIIQTSSSSLLKESSLDAIGYICREIRNPGLLAPKSNAILTALAHGMQSTETSQSIKLSAVNALNDSLEFAKANFEIENERNYIMQVVCELTQNENVKISVAALQCLVKIVSLYYEFMEVYIRNALFSITLNAMKSKSEEVALQGIEFWSSIGDKEIELAFDEADALENGVEEPPKISKQYARGALPYITPILLERLVELDDGDEDDWNPAKAASSCLMTLASCCGNDILPHVMPFTQANVKHQNWKHRDASLIVLGAVTEGLETNTLKPFVEQVLPILIESMRDTNDHVRDSAAWAIGQVCEVMPSVVISEPYLKASLECLINGLKEKPRIAASVCWAFSSLAIAAFDDAKEKEKKQAGADMISIDNPKTTVLSPYFEFIIPRLFEVTERSDSNRANLRTEAYKALMELLKNSPRDCYPIVQKVLIMIIAQLQGIIALDNSNTVDPAAAAANSADSKYMNSFSDLKSLLCGTLQSILNKIEPEDAPGISDTVMTVMLELLHQSTMVNKNSGLQEDALMAISSLIGLLADDFSKYMESFMPFLFAALDNYKECQLCKLAVAICGDIFREMKINYYEKYSKEMMGFLLRNLSSQDADRSMKPVILSAFGDLAMSGNRCFVENLPLFMTVFVEAINVQPASDSFEEIEYVGDLREAIFEGISSILHGLNSDQSGNKTNLKPFETYLPFIGRLIDFTTEAPAQMSVNIYLVAGLIYDLCTLFGAPVVSLFNYERTVRFLHSKLRACQVVKTKEMIAKTIRLLKSAKNNFATSRVVEATAGL